VALPEVASIAVRDRAGFERDVLGADEPIVMRGLAEGWPAVAAARAGVPAAIAYLKRFDTGRPIEVFLGKPAIRGRFFYREDFSGFNFARQKAPLGAVLDKLAELAGDPDPPAVYAGAAAASEHAPGFVRDNLMPLLAEADRFPRLWVGNATTVAPHFDQSRNVAVVVAGRRRFTLFPPDQLPNLYVGPLDFTMAGQPASMVDPAAPDLARFPRFAEALAHARTALLEPGDAIFLPPLWWHQVEASGPFNVLVNYWWGEPAEGSPFTALVHALLAVRDLPQAEREAWRGMFDHYVFGQSGADPVAHLPPAARGILGPSSPERTRKINDFVRNSMRD
jgi:hypothetical protein